LAEVVVLLGVDIGLPAKAFVLLVAVVGLSVLLFSERSRQRLKRFVSRHFRRPFHDYRQVWASFTERTTSLVEEAALCRTAVHWLSETFQVLSVTVWLTNERKDRLLFGASTALSEAIGDDRSRARDCSEIIRGLSNLSSPADFDQLRDQWTQSLKQMNPDFFPEKGGSRVCVPLRARGELLGLAILGDRVSGLPFSSEDLDLLKCVGDQVAGLLMTIQLSKKLLETKEMEAFQAMSAFFMHDLKNTAYTLGLLLENLKRHFEDPSFRADALKTVSKSVEHLNQLIERLTVLRRGLQIEPVAADLNEIATAALDNLMSAGRGSLTRSLGELPNIAVDPDQIQKVLVNLLLNAIDATSRGGEIRLETRQSDGWVVLSVTDTGCGMSPEFMEKSLFRPFQTTKKQGLGIGMFHSKLIVEAHGGRISVDSQQGKGTTVRVLLPIANRKP
jgi:putative PEP-CTERM system histidine kinase